MLIYDEYVLRNFVIAVLCGVTNERLSLLTMLENSCYSRQYSIFQSPSIFSSICGCIGFKSRGIIDMCTGGGCKEKDANDRELSPSGSAPLPPP